MLEPRETDLPALFLIFVVLPLIIYILLGKWSEATKKKDRISLLAQLAAEEALRAEAMVAASVIPLTPVLKNGVHECARCSGLATIRCSRCKSVRYCSGKCQIIHWRQVHKHECLQLETNSCSSFPMSISNEESIYERFLLSDRTNLQSPGYNIKNPKHGKTSADHRIHHSISNGASANNSRTSIDASGVPMMERRSTDRRVSHKSKLRREDETILDSTEVSTSSVTRSTSSSKELKSFDSVPLEEEIPRTHNVNISGGFSNGHAARSTMHESHDLQSQHEKIFDSRTNLGISSSFSSGNPGTNVCDIEAELMSGRENFFMEGITSKDETVELNCSSEAISTKRSIKAKSASHSPGTKMHRSQKSTMKTSIDQLCSEMERKGQIVDESKVGGTSDTVPAQGSNGVASMGIMKMIGLRKSLKLAKQESSGFVGEKQKKLKMLFPYEEFVKFFQYEAFDLSPRGLMNCGNSCYANAVLQCLTCTKPLTIYLLRRSHSRACCTKDWCLMCELEQHVTMLRESRGPLSPGRILSHMQSINRQIGDGSQEDAHEFLRLLVISMQSICLEGLGGENMVDPRLQETTFIQHTFGGRLKSKVKCLRCHHESERYENVMDLTLEIFGWVESLEDALTQFTCPEDLDGETCIDVEGILIVLVDFPRTVLLDSVAYKLQVTCIMTYTTHRFENELLSSTLILYHGFKFLSRLALSSIIKSLDLSTPYLYTTKEGSYGKINKCITFPDMLDMVPFMTGTDDIPPLYLLYAVVVHLDTLNASFSGHYV
ncbi:hypothetical protein ACSBR1_028225 [Camellia fascicularis]